MCQSPGVTATKWLENQFIKRKISIQGPSDFLLWAHGDRVYFMARVHGEEVAHFASAREQRRVRFSGANMTISPAIVLQERDLSPGP